MGDTDVAPQRVLGEVAGRLVIGLDDASGGSSVRQTSGRPRRSYSQHRVWNRQPGGGLTGDGTSPVRITRLRLRSVLGSGMGTAEREGPGVRMARPRIEQVRGADLDQLAEVHDADPVADVAHDRQVVRDEQVGQPELLAQLDQEVEDLGLDRDVERADRLVADDELRLDGEGASDADALPLPAGELVRVAVPVVRVQPDQREELGDLGPGGPLLPRLWVSSGSPMMDATVIRGFRRGVRVLEDDLHPAAHARSSSRDRASSRSRPSNTTSPPVGLRSRITARPVVLLPHPDSPTRPSVSPRRMLNDVVDRPYVRRSAAGEMPGRSGSRPAGP